jgi:broad specificity phosphatase PhoE
MLIPFALPLVLSLVAPPPHHSARDQPVERMGVITRRSLVVQTLPLATFAQWPRRAAAESVDPFFDRLRARYILLRPGETTFEAADIVDSNPINKGSSERGLTPKGAEQVRHAAEALRSLGVDSPVVFFDNGARASQTADILARELQIPRARMEPEFRWLEARGLGALDGTGAAAAARSVRRLDSLDIDNRTEPSDDGTPSDSVNDVFSRLRNTIAKIEQTYGSGDFVIVGGDASVLSILAAAACGVDLREHSRFELRPGEFFDLHALRRDVEAGRFEERAAAAEPSEQEVAAGRAVLRELGPRIFSETEAGAWVLGPGVRR